MKVEVRNVRNGRTMMMDERIAKALKGKVEIVTAAIKAEEPKIDPEISPRTGQPKRQYRRRDLTPEE